MWVDFNPAYNFFTLMLASAGAKQSPPIEIIGRTASADDSIVIFGPFGKTWKALPVGQPKIHFTGENTGPKTGRGVQLNLGFKHVDAAKNNYLRFPLWLLYIDWFSADFDRIVNPKPIPLERCTKVDDAEIARKNKFCAFVVSNPKNSLRNKAFHWLSKYKQVDSAGSVFNNMGADIFAGSGGAGGELKKLEYLKDYKFCLTYENRSSHGYTTEKYLHAKAAGCIPIYWGDPVFELDFNVDGCIDARGFKSPSELIEAVRRIDQNDAEWMKCYAVPALDASRVTWAQRTMAECARRLFSLAGFDVGTTFPEMLGDTSPDNAIDPP